MYIKRLRIGQLSEDSYQFHQHFTLAFFVPKSFTQLSLVTFQLCNFWHQNIGAKFVHKMLMKLTAGYLKSSLLNHICAKSQEKRPHITIKIISILANCWPSIVGPIQRTLSRREDENSGRSEEFDFIILTLRRSISKVSCALLSFRGPTIYFDIFW